MTCGELHEWLEATAPELEIEAEVTVDLGPHMRRLVRVTDASVLETAGSAVVRLNTA